MLGRVLIADATTGTAERLTRRLSSVQIEARTCDTDDSVLSTLGEWSFDVAVVDALLPRAGAAELCRRLHSRHNAIAVLVWTDSQDPLDAIVAYDAGADDYFPKELDPAVVEAKVRRALRRVLALRSPASTERHDSGVRELLERVHFEIPGLDARNLTRIEERLLAILSSARGELVETPSIVANVWGSSNVDGRTLYEHISTLRTKLLSLGWTIANTRGRGYRLARSAESGGQPPRVEPLQSVSALSEARARSLKNS
jgi:DNA-binding response OmpR family regulator